jgi:hypothetical protein
MEILPYLLILLVLTFFLTIARKNTITLNREGIVFKRYSVIGIANLILAYVFFIVFSVFRVIDVGLGGIDALGYKRIFENAGGSIVESMNNQFYEPGYSLIIWFSRTISEDYRVALFIIYTIMFLFIVNFIKNITYGRYTPVSIFLLLTLWLSSFNTTRVILSIFIGTYVYSCLLKRRYIKATLVAFIAISIHYSAIILLFIILIHGLVENKSKIKKARLLGLIAASTLFFLALAYLLDSLLIGTRYQAYIDWNEGQLSTGTLIAIIISVIIGLKNYNELTNINEYNRFFIIALFAFIPFFILQSSYAIIYRSIMFSLPILYVLIPDLIKSLKIRYTKDVFKFLLKAPLIGYFMIRIYTFFSVEIYSAQVPYINSLFTLFK